MFVEYRSLCDYTYLSMRMRKCVSVCVCARLCMYKLCLKTTLPLYISGPKRQMDIVNKKKIGSFLFHGEHHFLSWV